MRSLTLLELLSVGFATCSRMTTYQGKIGNKQKGQELLCNSKAALQIRQVETPQGIPKPTWTLVPRQVSGRRKDEPSRCGLKVMPDI